MRLASHAIVEIDAKDNSGDIRRMIEAQLEGRKSLEPLKARILEEVLIKSDGMFQWAWLQVQNIVSCRSERDIKARFEELALPADLNRTYAGILGRIQGTYDRECVNRAVRWVMCSAKPLTTRQLLAAICLKEQDGELHIEDGIGEEDLLVLCGTLLTKGSPDHLIRRGQRTVASTWRFSHASVVEYFETTELSMLEDHSHVAKLCLLLLMRQLPDDNFGERSLDGATLDEYVQDCWMKHVQALEEGPNTARPDISDLLSQFLGSPTQMSTHYERWHKQLRPYEGLRLSKPIFAVCHYSFFHMLQGNEWWGGTNFPYDATNKERKSLLQVATENGDRKICKALLSQGIAVDTKSASVAAEMGYSGILRLLLEQPDAAGPNANMEAEPTESTHIIYVALASAAIHRQIDCVQYLINAVARSNQNT